jgi:hypothetical protein
VITWQDDGANDGSGYGVYGQRFDAAGSALGGQFLINTTTTSTQYHNNVAAYPGGFAAVWSTGSDIYLQRFNNDGVKAGAETLVSTVPGGATAQGGSQYLPDVAAWSNGNLIVVWADGGSNDGSSYGVYGRLYNAAAGTFGSSFLVNTTTANQQSGASRLRRGAQRGGARQRRLRRRVALLPPGRQRLGRGRPALRRRGNKLGGEFVVNETTAGSQYQPEITALSTGGFVVTFYNDNYDISGAGTTADVYIREYDASGNPIDGQRKLESPTTAPPTSPPSPTWAAATSRSSTAATPPAPTAATTPTRSASSSSATAPPWPARPARSWATSPAPSPSSRTT